MKNLAFCDPVCERAREYASLRLDGELSELEEALLSAHLSRCDICHTFDADIRAMASALREAAFEKASAPIVIPGRRRAARQVLRVGTAAALLHRHARRGDGAARGDRKSTRLNSSHTIQSRMPSSA